MSGKSTLMNALVGERLSIITSKAQTTRHRIMGIVSGEEFQIIYSDTPGILKPAYKLQESMMKFVTGAVSDADVILYVTDTVEQGDRSAEIVGQHHAGAASRPSWSSTRSTFRTPEAARRAGRQDGRRNCPRRASCPSRPSERFNLEGLFQNDPGAAARRPGLLPQGYAHGQDAALLRLGDHPREDPADSTTRRSPTAAKSRSRATSEEPAIDRIAATIYVARDSQKGILIGHKGEKLKRVGQTAREDMEQFLGKKVFLQLFVKVSDDWRNNERQLRRFGYEQE